MNRTGSSGSRVGPAVTTARKPASGPAPCGAASSLRICRGDAFRLGQAARTELAARHRADVGRHHDDAVGFELGDVAAHGGVLPHAHIHGGNHQHRLVGGEQGGGGKVVGKAVGGLGHEVGGGGADDDKIGRARQLDMPHLGLVGEIEEFLENLLAGEGGHRQRRHELGARLGEDRARADAVLRRSRISSSDL